MNSVLRVLVITLCMALGTIASSASCDQPDVINLEGPRSVEVDLNGDGVSDFVFANFTNTGTYRGANYGYSINVRDTRNSDLLHSVHVYHDGYTPDDYAEGRRVVTTSKGTPECALRAHFLVRNAEDDVYELLTASKKTNDICISTWNLRVHFPSTTDPRVGWNPRLHLRRLSEDEVQSQILRCRRSGHERGVWRTRRGQRSSRASRWPVVPGRRRVRDYRTPAIPFLMPSVAQPAQGRVKNRKPFS